MTVLSVSEDGSAFQRFYLDKPVQVRPGITFCLSPVEESSTAELAAPEAPQVLEYRQVRDELRTLPSFRVESLYTLFYQEKEKGFFFPGEAHPMVELTYVDRGEVHSVADGENLLLKKGDMVLYAPEQWHMQYADMGEAPRYVTVSFHVEGQLPGQLYNRRLVAPREALELLEQMHIQPGSLSEVVSKVEHCGLIERRRAERDRRIWELQLTEKGRDRAIEFEQKREETAVKLFSVLTPEQKNDFGEILSILLENWDASCES